MGGDSSDELALSAMSRRIEIELTSSREDGTWTWRAAGAREPKGVLESDLLPGPSKVGDLLKVDADFGIDGITIVHIVPPKGGRKEPELLEVLGTGRAFEPVTQTLVGRTDRPRSDRPRSDRPRSDRPAGDRPRGDRPGGDRPRSDRPRSERPGGDRPGADRPGTDRAGADRSGAPRRDRPARSDGTTAGPRHDRPSRPPVPELPSRPKPKRLRAVKIHRNAVMATLPEEHKPIAEQLLRGGMPAVRQALQEQNENLRKEDKPEIKPTGMLALAEELMPKLRVADWLDRAEGALNDVDELDLRDLRSVVVAADDPTVARDETTREMAAKLKAALTTRQEAEHTEWLADITAALDIGRSVRALRLSSRPPKAGVRFPAELGGRLAEVTAASIAPDASSDRWVAVLEALAYSPIRTQVTVPAAPTTVSDELKSTVTRLASLLPDIARVFGIDPPAPGSRSARPPRPATRKPGPAKAKPIPAPPTSLASVTPASPSETSVVETPAAAETPVVETPVVETPAAAETPVVETPVTDAIQVETSSAE